MNTFLYGRVSSDAQDVELSISGQMRALREYATKNGFTIVREFVDEAQSGRSADRPAFKQMIDLALDRSHPIDVILVWKLSRFARDRRDSVTFKYLLQQSGVKVVSINEPTEDSPAGRMLTGMIETIDEFYSDSLGEDISRGMSEAASLGFYVGSIAPYGYRKVEVPGHQRTRWTLEPDPAEAALVLRAFRSVSSGLGLKRLARELNEEGLRTRSGTRWNKAGLQKLLTSEVYVGTLVWNTGSRRKALSAPKPPVRIEDAWPAIVSRELFNAVGRTMSARSPKIIHPRQASSAYLLSGFTFCSSCRTALIGHSAKSGRYHYYLCSSRDKGRGTGCRLRMTRREVLEDVVIARTRDRLLSDENVRELVEIVNEELAVSHTERGAQTKKLDREISDVRKRLERYYDAFERGALVAEELGPRLDELNCRLAELEAARARIQLERDPHTVSYTEVRERASH